MQKTRPLPLLVACAALVLPPLPALAVRPAPAPPRPPSGAAALGQDPQDEEAELEALLAEERAEADRLRRRGEVDEARRMLRVHLADLESDAESRLLLARCERDRGRYGRALEHYARAARDAEELAAPRRRAVRASAAREAALLLVELGRPAEALERIDGQREALDPRQDPRDAWAEARVLRALGRREQEQRLLAHGARGAATSWDRHLARARCLRALGRLEEAHAELLAGDEAARAESGSDEPELLVERGDLLYEADREVAEAAARSPRKLYDRALELRPGDEGALLGLFELHRTNWRRTSRTAPEILAELFDAHPETIRGRVVGARADLEDGRLVSARRRLAELEERASGRRDVRALVAALAWIEHREDDCRAELEALQRVDPSDSAPEREVGTILLELYRFAEGLPFLEAATRRDPSDYDAWTQLGRALANTGREEEAREALARARRAAGRRQDAWRNNMSMVLERLAREYRVREFGELSFAWKPDAEPLLELYLVPFYRQAREELARRYGFTPGPVRIEVFRRHADFSVRSTGFEGFPALGVCFGPVVTSLSPLAELRGRFSWARTSFHEFTHVIHLGLSHNRCPRWITEGLATWEEVNRSPSWSRNMRRDLVDALANGDLIPLRDLNRAFRGPRILFGYYQGGLVCEMLVRDHGFPPMVRLLEAFDRGDDLDTAFREVFGRTPEEVDQAFERFVRERVADLRIEPTWSDRHLFHLALEHGRTPPEDPQARRAWAEERVTLAWGAWQRGKRVDAEDHLRLARRAVGDLPRASFLAAEIALAGKDPVLAARRYREGLAAGGEEFRARIALAGLEQAAGNLEEAERHLLAAERDFPGFPDRSLAAELKLAELYRRQGRTAEAMAARERYLAYDAGDGEGRRQLARWHARQGRFERAEELFREANEVDPFVRSLHREWAGVLVELGRHEEVLREVRAARAVPPELDGEPSGPTGPAEQAELAALEAAALAGLGRPDEAREAARRALELDGSNERARQVLDALGEG